MNFVGAHPGRPMVFSMHCGQPSRLLPRAAGRADDMTALALCQGAEAADDAMMNEGNHHAWK
jgi:hypothetical protein